MIPKKELSELLQQRLTPHMPAEKVQELIGDILRLEEGWEELDVAHRDMGYSMSVNCSDICWLADQIDRGAVFKIFRRKNAPQEK